VDGVHSAEEACGEDESSPARREARVGQCILGGGFVFKAHRLVYHSTLGSRVIKSLTAAPASWRAETGILLPNNQRQHVTSHAPKDMLPLYVESSCQHSGAAGGHLFPALTASSPAISQGLSLCIPLRWIQV